MEIFSKEFINKYNNVMNLIMSSKNVNQQQVVGLLIEFYDSVKENKIEDSVNIIRKIEWYIYKHPIKYIIDTDSDFKCLSGGFVFDEAQFLKGKSLDSFSSSSKLLDFIVSLTRNHLFFEYAWGATLIPHKTGIDAIDLTNLCLKSSEFIKKICDILKLRCVTVRIDPGFCKQAMLLNGNGFHYFSIVYIENEEYIIDCTYKQFFEIYSNILEKMGIVGLSGCFPGIYMLQNESRKTTAQALIKNGWIKMDEVQAKNYFDGFALSYRNASYYEEKGFVDYVTPYTLETYKNFIFGDDTQINHEGFDNLGIQKRLIKNPNIKFKTNESIIKNLY